MDPRSGEQDDPATSRLLCRRLRSAGTARLSRAVPLRRQALPETVARRADNRRSRARFRRPRALDHRGVNARLAGLHPLRVPSAGSAARKNTAPAEMAARAARAALGSGALADRAI